MLKGKTVYCIVTGAHRTTTIALFLNMLKNEHADNIILMPTAAAEAFLDLQTIPEDVIIRRTSKGTMQIPEEDVVVVAPCTFNTFSKIATGVADSYPMSILHAAIGKKKPVVIVPSMGEQYWWHPITAAHLRTMTGFGVEVIWPEYIYNSSGVLEKLTMAPWAKVLDSVCHKFKKIRYDGLRVRGTHAMRLIDEYYASFAKYGDALQQNHYTNAAAGFLAMRVDESNILITRSGAFVGNLTRDDITVVTNHDNHIVSWYGVSEPSSETPLVLDIFDQFPEVNAIIHGHCRDITYSPKMLKYLSNEYLAYGQWGEIFKISDLLKWYHFAIMKLHGEIVVGKCFKEALTLYYEKYQETL